MNEPSSPQELIGEAPTGALASIQWQRFGSVDQQAGLDPLGNEWLREIDELSPWDGEGEEPETPARDARSYRMWTFLRSDHRDYVRLAVLMTVDEEGKVEDVEIDAALSFGFCDGGRGSAEVEEPEEEQVGEFLAELCRWKPRAGGRTSAAGESAGRKRRGVFWCAPFSGATSALPPAKRLSSNGRQRLGFWSVQSRYGTNK